MSRVRLRLPATSANLGPGFDTLALAVKLYLEIEAEAGSDFLIEASGRDAAICGATENNLLIRTYREFLGSHQRPIIPLRLRMKNGIPLGMGCGSSAAVRLAAVALGVHFGQMGWNRQQILTEACRLEGHPDNAAACWLGGFVASAFDGKEVWTVSLKVPSDWRAAIVMPHQPLATPESRAVLPASYERREVIANLQRIGLLTAAFAAGRGDLLSEAMRDWLHQPYRAAVCPLLGRLLPLSGLHGIAGMALSGAGPAVLMIALSEEACSRGVEAVRNELQAGPEIEILTVQVEDEPATFEADHPGSGC